MASWTFTLAAPTRPIAAAAVRGLFGGLAWTVVVASLVLPATAKDRALVIGIGTYADSHFEDLDSTAVAGNIAAVESLLKGKLAYKPDEIKLLRDKEATREAILKGIEEWLRPDKKEIEQRAKEEEEIKTGKLSRKKIRALRRKWAREARQSKRSFLYFSGQGRLLPHLANGVSDGRDEAILPFDARRDRNGHSVVESVITDTRFTEALRSLEGRNVTVVIDAGFPAPASASPAPENSVFTDYGFLQTLAFKKGILTVWMSSPPGYRAPVENIDGTLRGLFTENFTAGIGAAEADRNGNAVVSNTELLFYLMQRYAAHCTPQAVDCSSYGQPLLKPATAHRYATTPVKRSYRRKLSLELLTDYLVTGDNAIDLVMEQEPPSPVPVGSTQIRFKVKAPVDGTLVLLSLTKDGQLLQLYPNQLDKGNPAASSGYVDADTAVTVPPDNNLGFKLTATDPAEGHVIAVFGRGRVPLSKLVTDRSIGAVPRSEAIRDYLPGLVTAFLGRDAAPSVDGNPKGLWSIWSVHTLPFEFVP